MKNYYTVLNVNTTTPEIGLCLTDYTDNGPMSPGPIIFLVLIGVIFIGGMIGLWVVIKDS